MNTIPHYYSIDKKSEREALQDLRKELPIKQIFSFWASDSALAFEYFHTRLGFSLVETTRTSDGICSMSFAPNDNDRILFHIQFNQDEEHYRLLDNDSEFLESPKQFLKLVPVINTDAGGCIFMSYHEYE